ncbi:MAG: hypothetical protein AAGA30_12030, partial [Planctomycetota bacterium]
FLKRTIMEGEGFCFDDRQIMHHATDVQSETTGHRDIFVFNISRWKKKRYGEAFERTLVGKNVFPNGKALQS